MSFLGISPHHVENSGVHHAQATIPVLYRSSRRLCFTRNDTTRRRVSGGPFVPAFRRHHDAGEPDLHAGSALRYLTTFFVAITPVSLRFLPAWPSSSTGIVSMPIRHTPAQVQRNDAVNPTACELMTRAGSYRHQIGGGCFVKKRDADV